MSSTYTEAVEVKAPFDWQRVFFLFLGVALFSIIYYAPPWPDAVDPMGKHFTLSVEGKGALARFALAATWWIFEV
jgi:sodium-dependent dicarboxylate transporter 2/3/5